MPKKTAESAMQLIENQRGIIRVLRSDPSDYADLLFELNQFADPENNRPLRPLESNADRTQVYDSKLKTFVSRKLKRKERGLPQPGNQRIKAVSGTLPPKTGNMRFYNHANINKNHKHVIYGVDAGEDPDRYLYLHKNDPAIEVKDEACLIVACFAKDAGTNTKWHIKGQPLNEYHAGQYPEAISFAQLKENNRNFVRNFNSLPRHKDERNEVKFKPSKAAIHFVGSVSDGLEDRVNALHFKLLVWKILKIDLPVLIFDDKGKHLYPEKEQAQDILIAFSRGISYAFDIHDKIKNGEHPTNSIFTKYIEMFVDYCEYVKKIRLLNSDETLARFFDYHETKTQEEKSSAVTDLTRTDDYTNAVSGRKLWGEIVSNTYDYEVAHPKDNSYVLEKLDAAEIKGDLEKIYQQMCTYLQQNTKIVLAFKAQEVMQNMPVSLAYLNLSEINALKLQQDRERHQYDRSEVENITFSYLKDMRAHFNKTMQARPRYAYFTFIDETNYPKPLTNNFGLSYFILRDVMKFNSLFVPENVINNFKARSTPIRPCTYFHFDVLLSQASETLLLGVAHAVTGQLPHYQIRENAKFEMQAYIPSIELFNQDVVERLYVSPDEYKMSEAEIAFLNEHGIKATNVGTHAYAQEEMQIEAAALADDVETIQRIMRQHPFLRQSFAQALEKGNVALYHYLLKHDPEAKPLPWQALWERVPIDKLELFHPEWTEVELKALNGDDFLILMDMQHEVMADLFNEPFRFFLKWLKQFNAANIKLKDVEAKGYLDNENPNVLLGTFLGGRMLIALVGENTCQTQKIIDLLDSGLVHPDTIRKTAHAVFRNPNFKLIVEHLITKKYYQLTHEDSEKQALLNGGNYLHILDDPRMVAQIPWGDHTTLEVISELLKKRDDVAFIERTFLHMKSASAFANLRTATEDVLLTRVAEKNPALLYVFMAVMSNVDLYENSSPFVCASGALVNKHECDAFMRYLHLHIGRNQVVVEETKEGALQTVADWQAQFLHDLHHNPRKLRYEKYIKIYCDNLPSFDFLYVTNPLRYSLVCMQFYFPELVEKWISSPHLLSFSQLQELTVYCLRNDKAYFEEVSEFIDLQPELIHTQVPGSNDTLLHLALAADCKNSQLIRKLMRSKVAHVNNTAGHSTLQDLMLMFARVQRHASGGVVHEIFDSIASAFLEEIPFCNEQLISVLNAMIQTHTRVAGGYAKQICAVLNKNKAQDVGLQRSFILAISKHLNETKIPELWGSYLQIKSMPQSAFQEAIACMVKARYNIFTKQDIHDVLDCAIDFNYNAIASFLDFNNDLNLYIFSHILSHPKCVVTDAAVDDRLVLAFADLFQDRTLSKTHYAVILENFLIILDKLNLRFRLRQHGHDFLNTLIAGGKYAAVLVLLRFQFVLSEAHWDILLENYKNDNRSLVLDSHSGSNTAIAKQSLIHLTAILQTQPQRLAAAWRIFYDIRLSSADNKYLCKTLRSLKRDFCEGIEVDASLLAQIDEEMKDTIDKMTQNAPLARRDLSYAIENHNFLRAVVPFMSTPAYVLWKADHPTLVKEFNAYELNKAALLYAEEKVVVSCPKDVSTEASLDQLIAILNSRHLTDVIQQDAKAQLKTKLAMHDSDKGVEPDWYTQEHFTQLRRTLKTYSVLCQLESHDDPVFTRIRISYYYFMLRVIAYAKEERPTNTLQRNASLFSNPFSGSSWGGYKSNITPVENEQKRRFS